MKKASVLCLVLMAGAFAGPAEAIYKCTTAKGVVYQDRPCREGTETDVRIVIPTGEMAPKALPAQDENAQVNGARGEGRFGAPKTDRATGDDAASVTKPADKKSSNDAALNSGEDARTKGTRSSADARVPITAEQAQKTEPSAKYYTTDGTASGVDTPEQMTCESPSGEKRRFILTNGKLTSI
jgi:hypothetical protein